MSMLQIAVFFFITVALAALFLGWATPSDSARLRERMERLGGRHDADSLDGLSPEEEARLQVLLKDQ